MNPAVFKDLCLDASDPSTLGSFWSQALGLELHHQTNGDTFLTGSSDAQRIWINQVSEPRTAKNRIHLDIHGDSVNKLEKLGATVLDAESYPWTVMTDPDGGEFCLFLREQVPAYRLYEVVIDCLDERAQARWWAELIGGNSFDDERGFSYIQGIPEAPFEALTFSPVPEPKTTKNRVHLDLVSKETVELIDRGATMLRQRDDEINWNVLADPEGNEFCVFSPESG